MLASGRLNDVSASAQPKVAEPGRTKALTSQSTTGDGRRRLAPLVVLPAPAFAAPLASTFPSLLPAAFFGGFAVALPVALLAELMQQRPEVRSIGHAVISS